MLLLRLCRGCRGLGWVSHETHLCCPSCYLSGAPGPPLNDVEQCFEDAISSCVSFMKDHGFKVTGQDPHELLQWFLGYRPTAWERIS